MERILIVDDEKKLLRSLEDFFSTQGYEVLCAARGDEAVKIALEKAPDRLRNACRTRRGGPRETAKGLAQQVHRHGSDAARANGDPADADPGGIHLEGNLRPTATAGRRSRALPQEPLAK